MPAERPPESRVKYFGDDLKFLITLAVFIASVVLAYSQLDKSQALLQEKLAVIEGNHLVHIQEDIEEIKQENKLASQNIMQVNDTLIKLLVKLEQYDISVK